MDNPKPDEVIFQTRSKIRVVLAIFGFMAVSVLFLFAGMFFHGGEIPWIGSIPPCLALAGLIFSIPHLRTGLAKGLVVTQTMVHIQTYGPAFDLSRDGMAEVHLERKLYGWLANHGNLSIRMKDGRKIFLYYVMDAVALRKLIDPTGFPPAERGASSR